MTIYYKYVNFSFQDSQLGKMQILMIYHCKVTIFQVMANYNVPIHISEIYT